MEITSKYFPYFRGKQYELITIRENAALMSRAGFVPIIEPVKESLNGLKRALGAVEEAKGRVILIVNPAHGDHSHDNTPVAEYAHELSERPDSNVGILLNNQLTASAATALAEEFSGQPLAFIHAGFSQHRELAEQLEATGSDHTHVFFEKLCGKIYRRHFQTGERVLIRDGFQRRPNRDHPNKEHFSDLHITYSEESVDAFGDFLIVGDEYFETGGPAYAIAIHITFVDQDADDEMYISHFVSDRSSTPTDPAGKFAEALKKLVTEARRPNTPIARTAAIEEFIDLHDRQHFPGLGYVKKLSMNHHIESLDRYFAR